MTIAMLMVNTLRAHQWAQSASADGTHPAPAVPG
jgi:hypothetical protein